MLLVPLAESSEESTESDRNWPLKSTECQPDLLVHLHQNIISFQGYQRASIVSPGATRKSHSKGRSLTRSALTLLRQRFRTSPLRIQQLQVKGVYKVRVSSTKKLQCWASHQNPLMFTNPNHDDFQNTFLFHTQIQTIQHRCYFRRQANDLWSYADNLFLCIICLIEGWRCV